MIIDFEQVLSQAEKAAAMYTVNYVKQFASSMPSCTENIAEI